MAMASELLAKFQNCTPPREVQPALLKQNCTCSTAPFTLPLAKSLAGVLGAVSEAYFRSNKG